MTTVAHRQVGGLRDRLRRDLEPDHDRVDAAFAALVGVSGGASGDDLPSFLSAMRAGFAAMPATPSGVRDDVLSRLDADLARLGAAPGPAVPPVDAHPLAADYVMLGSRSGAAYLARAWADVPGVAGSAFFAADVDRAPWHALSRDLAAHPADGAFADRVVADARAAFGAFLAAAGSDRGRAAA